MSREQIEEMMKHCPFYEKGKCILLEEKEVECDMNCDLCDFAKSLYNAGYRKQSENTVEVVRCKDCEYHHWEQEPCHGKTIHKCSVLNAEVFKDFYCYHGKQKMKGGAE